MKVIATYNIKGGVGKTATAVNLAWLAAAGGARTLVWDLDPQGAATFYFRVKPKVKGGGEAIIHGRRAIDRAVKGTDFDNLDLLPADFSYRNMDLDLDPMKRRTRRIDLLLRPLAKEYDYVLLDCPPSISLVSENVFRAADALLVPLIPTTLSIRTLEQLDAFLDDHKARKRQQVLAFFSMVDQRKRLHRDLVERVRADRPDVLASQIPAASDIERMGIHRAPLPAYAPRSRSAAAYRALWDEVAARL
ncbi:MAG TPA: AAA family ATPase [Acidimicrobiales bacterium]|nr:AAA family ATPase [Acidimicrobiales bacterium]